MALRTSDTPSLDDHYYGVVIYMAPEYINNNDFYPSSDIYSLGVIYFELTRFFATDMERFITITQARNRAYNGDDHIYTKTIRRILRKNPNKRLNIHRIRNNILSGT